MHTEAEGGIEVDAYIEHRELEAVLKQRLADGWTEERFMECKSKNDQEYCTIIWRK